VTRRGILAVGGMAAGHAAAGVSLIQGTLGAAGAASAGAVFLHQEILVNPISLFTVRHTNLLPPLSFLAGAVLGLLGFPRRRKPPEQ
jgi:hypothetical protein